MPAIVHIDYRYADTKKNLPRLQAVMARIDEKYYMRLAKEAEEREKISLLRQKDIPDILPAP